MKLGLTYFALSNHCNKIGCRFSYKLISCSVRLRIVRLCSSCESLDTLYSASYVFLVNVSKGCSCSKLLAEFERKSSAYSNCIKRSREKMRKSMFLWCILLKIR